MAAPGPGPFASIPPRPRRMAGATPTRRSYRRPPRLQLNLMVPNISDQPILPPGSNGLRFHGTVWVSVGVAFWEYEHEYLEASHDCGGVARSWNFAGAGAERSTNWRPTAGGWRR